MKSVQEIFDIVINHGHFSPRVEISRTSPYMCRALDVAALNGAITRSEEHKAALAIHEYLKPTGCISSGGRTLINLHDLIMNTTTITGNVLH